MTTIEDVVQEIWSNLIEASHSKEDHDFDFQKLRAYLSEQDRRIHILNDELEILHGMLNAKKAKAE